MRRNINASRPLKWEWVFVIATAIILTSLYIYNDIADATAQGIKFWNCLFGDGINEFYNRPYLDGVEGTICWKSGGGTYDFVLYTLFALYDFPLWVLEKLSKTGYAAFYLGRWYAKGITWVYSGISAHLLYKIALLCDLDENEARWAPLLFITAPLFFYTEVVISGFDIISVAFSLLGIYGYLKKNTKLFIGGFAVAATAKLFALWLFIPLLLLREKKIRKIMAEGIGGVSLVMIPRIFFAVQKYFRKLARLAAAAEAAGTTVQAGGGNAAVGATEVRTSTMFKDVSNIIGDAIFPAGTRSAEYTILTMDNLPLLFVGMIMIWVWCYLNRKELKNRQVISLCALVMFVFTLTAKLHPYWVILLVPYVILLILFRPERMWENLILEGVFSCGYLLNKVYGYYWLSNLDLIDYMFRPQHRFSFASPDVNSADYGLSHYLSILFRKVGLEEYNIMRLGSGIAVAGAVLFIVMNYYWSKEDPPASDIDYAKRRKWLTVRFLTSCLVGMLPMIGLIQYLS